ncbi:hypothetical protein VN12_19295 [Pirellula sp. SH-Sr6A]|nr:hypothetical protein VN12_19295 [Pirellula sp. SH-Sr6A]
MSPLEVNMGRSYAACLGCLALASCIGYGLLMSAPAEDILVRGISMLFVFAVIGWVVGKTAETIVRQSIEWNYRATIERLRQRNSGVSGE